ncbi:MAG: hypothetical protein V1754_04695 [Pseudomonadota bacterium]
MDDDRPRKSWREIDKAKDRSAHRKEERPAHGGGKSTKRTQQSYRATLDRLFESGRVGQLIEKKAPGSTEGAEGGRIKLLRKIKEAEGVNAVTEAVDVFLKEHPLPDDSEILAKMLEHRDPDRQQEALERLHKVINVDPPKRARALIGRLKLIRDTADEPVMIKIASELIEKLE